MVEDNIDVVKSKILLHSASRPTQYLLWVPLVAFFYTN